MAENKARDPDIDRLKYYFGTVLDHFNMRSYKPRNWEMREALDWYEDGTVICAHRMMGELEGKDALEIGFGMGAHLVWMANRGANVTGIDITEERVAAAARLIEAEGLSGRVKLICGDIRGAELGNDRFDIIYGHDILMYLGGEYGGFINMMRGLLKDGGKMVIVEALDGNPIARLYRSFAAPKEFRHFTTYFDIDSLSVFEGSFRYFASEFFYLLTPLAFLFKNWFASKTLFRYLERRLSVIDAALMRVFPLLKRYCWRVVFEVRR